MAGIPGIPQSFTVQTANQQILVSWNLSSGATSYDIQRSEDNVTYTALTSISGTPLATSYLDTSVTLGTQYFYKVRSTNSDGSSSYTNAASAIPTPTGEMTLSQIRLEAKQRADRVNSNFVSDPEWRGYINKAMFELYDLLVTEYEDYFLGEPIALICDGSTAAFTLPNGSNTFLRGNDLSQSFTPPPFYKLMGVDLALSNATNAFVTVNKFNFSDRNRFVYPNTASTIYGVFNLQYRVMGNKIRFIPTPAGGQALQFWYIPRLAELLQETDTTDIGISGWLEYVIVRSAKYALDKEESDSSKLDAELLFLKARIEEAASNRDAGMPDTISDVNNGNWANGWSGGRNGAIGGF